MVDIGNMTLRDLVMSYPKAAILFERVHLDFCCKGNRKLEDVLINDQSGLAEVKSELEKIILGAVSTEPDFKKYSLAQLINHIVITHHQYVKENIPVIQQHLIKLVAKHGEKYPFMKTIAVLFEEISKDFENHMMKEELILFPKIIKVEMNDEISSSISMKTIIKVMELEHEDAGKAMNEIRVLCHDYSVPENACITFRIVMDELKMFEADLHKHVHLENNILFPRVIELQKQQSDIVST